MYPVIFVKYYICAKYMLFLHGPGATEKLPSGGGSMKQVGQLLTKYMKYININIQFSQSARIYKPHLNDEVMPKLAKLQVKELKINLKLLDTVTPGKFG